MHTDRKIGFAMGILLIGIVAALFFRNEPLVDNRVPTVRREQELNERLKERDVPVYLNDTSVDTSAEADEAEEQAWTLRDVLKGMDKRNKIQPSPVTVGDFASEETPGRTDRLSDDGFRVGRSNQDAQSTSQRPSVISVDRNIASAPSTILPPLPPVVAPDVPAPADPAESVPVTAVPVTTTPGASALAEEVPDEFDEYTVKYGDTLSGIAERLLGSQSRYQEIYEANRDRMTSPDRLDVGKPIRIPRVSRKESPSTQ